MLDRVGALVREVGQSLVAWRAEGGTDGSWEGTQFHAKADRWAHERLALGLRSIGRNLPIVSEEDPASQVSAAEEYWIIDPIDGTASYSGGYAGYVTQVALMRKGVPVLAAVFAPASDELFTAEKGCGAWKNGSRLSTEKREALILIDNYPSPRGAAADLFRDLSFTRYEESGSIGLKICRIADGTADVFFKAVAVRDWDVAGPQLILEEAGGILLDGVGSCIRYGSGGRIEGLVAASTAHLAKRIVDWHVVRTGRLEQPV